MKTLPTSRAPFSDCYVDPAEFTPDPEELDQVERLLKLRRFHGGHRGVAHEVFSLMWRMGWRPGF